MTLSHRILLQIAIAAGLVILVATGVTYWLVFSAAEQQGLNHLSDYVAERARVEEAGLRRIAENLELARGQFLRRNPAPPPLDFQEQWDKWFEKYPDGAWRSRREFSDGRKWSTLWLHKDVPLTPEIQTQILRANNICNDFLPTWIDSFPSLYFVFPYQANIGFDARIPNWVWETPADYDNNAIEALAGANPQSNPSRRIVWNSVLEEPTSLLPFVSVMLPVDADGKHIATIGHDIHALQLLDDSTRSSLPGTTHFIFREDGRLIAHRGKMKEILASRGHLTMQDSGDAALQSLYAASQTGKQRLLSGYDAAGGCYYAISRLEGPDWLFITTMPRLHLRQQAFRSAQWVLWSGLLSLALVSVIFALVLQRQVAKPLAELARATGQMAAGDLSARAVVSGDDELGRLAADFNDMVSKVALRNAELSALNETLESRVAGRTVALRESEERFIKLFQFSPTPSVLTRADRGIAAANEAFLKTAGYTEAEVLNKTAAELQLNAVPEQQEEFARAIYECGKIRDKEQFLRTKDNRIRTILVSAELLELGGQPHVLTAGLDITERKLAEVETLKTLAREKELSELKTNFVSMVSHEFRTPLGVIQSAADVLDRYLDRLSPEDRRDHIGMIFRSTRGLAHLVDSVRLLGRVEDGRRSFLPAPRDFPRLCREIADEVRSATAARCPVEIAIPDNLEGGRSDADLLRHILTNLLGNAVKYSEPDSPVLLSATRIASDVVITVRDHGIGIPEADRNRLFTSFARGSNVGSRPGSGLGLLIVKRCVELHRGSIQIQSQPGEGTTVTVRLPLFSQPLLHLNPLI